MSTNNADEKNLTQEARLERTRICAWLRFARVALAAEDGTEYPLPLSPLADALAAGVHWMEDVSEDIPTDTSDIVDGSGKALSRSQERRIDAQSGKEAGVTGERGGEG